MKRTIFDVAIDPNDQDNIYLAFMECDLENITIKPTLILRLDKPEEQLDRLNDQYANRKIN
jgi:hypothetical protein